MSSLLLHTLASEPWITCGLAGVVAAIVLITKLSQPSKAGLNDIPTVGSSSWLGSWWAGLVYPIVAPDILQEGYEKHKSTSFKVAVLHRWIIILSNPQHVEELRRAHDDSYSFIEGILDLFNIQYILGPEVYHKPYHVPIVRNQLTQNIGALYPEIRDEISTAFEDVLDLTTNEWKSLPALSSMQKVVGRTTSRVFVGLPLCRDPDWTDLNVRFGVDFFKAGRIIFPLPELLKPIAVRLFTNIHQSRQLARKHLGPVIKERLRLFNEHGDEWADKPNDFLAWLMEEGEDPDLTVESLTNRMLTLNFVAIHTTALSFTYALFYLAANPQYIQPLREEVEAIIKKEGWSKAALGKMRKIDSFLKESQRLQGVGIVSMIRKASKDFTFSDGTFVPKGTTIMVAAQSIHHDEAFYQNAHTFEPFRYVDLREVEGMGVKHQFTSTTTEYVPFGHGRNACPGRFFAASVLKSMLAHVVMKYDVKLADNSTRRPQTLHFAMSLTPDPSAKVMFRRRVD